MSLKHTDITVVTTNYIQDQVMGAELPIKDAVKEKYGEAASRVASGLEVQGCCSTGDCDPITGNLYDSKDAAAVPEEALKASLGCGNTTELAELHPGEIVLDLGSGGGIDVLLSAKRVGPTGKAYGLDMTDEMLALARRNQSKAGVQNVEFLKGEIENIPLPDNSVDVIISNCVINLSTDKDAVFREAFRVLRPGGRLCVSDIVLKRPLPIEIRENLEEWAGCIAGALVKEDYLDRMRKAGFATIEIRDEKEYSAPVEQGDKIMSITLRALKP